MDERSRMINCLEGDRFQEMRATELGFEGTETVVQWRIVITNDESAIYIYTLSTPLSNFAAKIIVGSKGRKDSRTPEIITPRSRNL